MSMTNHNDGYVYDAEFEEARAQLKLAKTDHEKANAALTEKKLLADRSDRARMRAEKMAAEARSKDTEASRKGQEAKRKATEAKRRGLPTHRLESEAVKWSGDAQRASAEIRRFEEEGRRKERESREVAKEINAQSEIVTEKLKVVQDWIQRAKFLTGNTTARMAAIANEQEEAAQAEPTPLSVTGGAAAALKSTLDTLERSPGQALRLNVGEGDSVSLFLDAQREGDQLVTLSGATLDISETSNGINLVLRRHSEVPSA
jgi:hypothetical protein